MQLTDGGRRALDTHAPAAAAALNAVEAAAWQVAADRGLTDLVDLSARVVAAPHDLSPLDRPATLGPSPWAARPTDDWRAFGDLDDVSRTAVAFAEQFSIDVSAIDDDQRATLGAALVMDTGDYVQAVWALDMVPRLRAALDALFGPSTWPTAEPDLPDGGLWGAIDGYIRVVPGLERLDPVLTELVRLRGARQHQCRLCQSLRSRPALQAGADESLFESVDAYATSDLGPDQKAALALTDAIVWLPGRIDPAVAHAVRANLDDGQCVELVLDVVRNATNKIAVAFAADDPHVTEGVEIYEITPDGEAHYGLTLD